MSIHFVSGKPGGGKTLYGLKLIVEELVLGKREIFTNVPLNLPELNAYVQARYPAASRGKAPSLTLPRILACSRKRGRGWRMKVR